MSACHSQHVAAAGLSALSAASGVLGQQQPGPDQQRQHHPDFQTEAQRRAYAAAQLIDWPGGFYRTDIGWRALARET